MTTRNCTDNEANVIFFSLQNLQTREVGDERTKYIEPKDGKIVQYIISEHPLPKSQYYAMFDFHNYKCATSKMSLKNCQQKYYIVIFCWYHGPMCETNIIKPLTNAMA